MFFRPIFREQLSSAWQYARVKPEAHAKKQDPRTYYNSEVFAPVSAEARAAVHAAAEPRGEAISQMSAEEISGLEADVGAPTWGLTMAMFEKDPVPRLIGPMKAGLEDTNRWLCGLVRGVNIGAGNLFHPPVAEFLAVGRLVAGRTSTFVDAVAGGGAVRRGELIIRGFGKGETDPTQCAEKIRDGVMCCSLRGCECRVQHSFYSFGPRYVDR